SPTSPWAVPVNRRRSPRWSCSSPPACRATSRAPSPRSPAAVTSDRLATALNGVGLGTGTEVSEPDSAGDEGRLLAVQSTFVSREIPATRRRGGPAHRRGGGSALASRLGLPACRFGAPARTRWLDASSGSVLDLAADDGHDHAGVPDRL